MSFNTVADEKAGGSVTAFMSAIGVENLGSLPFMLKALATEAGACGCVLWETAASSGLGENGPTGYLVSLGQWFPEGHLYHSNPSLDSPVGEAVLSQRPVYVEDVAADSREFTGAGFFERAGVKGMFVVPVNYGFGERGAVSLFMSSAEPLSPETTARIECMVSAVPILYRAVRNEVRHKLTGKVDKVLGRGEARNPSRVPINHRVKRDLFQLCKVVADSLQCGEASIFLKDASGGPHPLRLAATTRQEQSAKSNQHEQGGELNGWTTGRAAPIHVLDLCRVGDDGESYEHLLPDPWFKAAEDGDGTEGNGDEVLRPLSLIIVPINSGGELLGCIRCCTNRKDGRHLTTQDFELLEYVAARFGRYWDNWLRECEAHEERLSWRTLLQGLGALDDFAFDALARGVADAERLICEEALRLAASAMKGADVLDVRVADEDEGVLRLFAVHGDAWERADATPLRQFTFPLDDSDDAAWADALQKGGTCMRTGNSIERFYSENFPGASQMMTFPIPLPGGRRGVLDVCTTGGESFSEHDTAFAEVLSKRLGCYGCQTLGLERMAAADAARLAALDRALEAEAKLEESEQIHNQLHEDLSHQLRSPIISAHARVQKVLSREPLGNELKKKLQAIRGLCSKVSKVTMSTKLFAALARGDAFVPNLSPLWHDDLYKMLVELVSDNGLLVHPAQCVSFRINLQAMTSLPTSNPLADVDNDLIQQALNNLLDNAGKYSYENTTVRIAAALDKDDNFFISVVNRGLPINASDARECTKRRWRGDKAKKTIGEGSGLGLWIVKHIMNAHGGKLEVIPTTTPNNETEVRLVFPKRREAR
jgi:signal transduction histidine kinase